MSVSDAVGSLGSSITSPAKLIFIAYVALAYTGKVATSRSDFFWVAFIFFVLQVGHDDYLRMLLNGLAKRHVGTEAK